MVTSKQYAENIQRRREFHIAGYATLKDMDLDGDYVSPYQITSRSQEGPVLVCYNWLDVPSIIQNKSILSRFGYLPGILFNNVLDEALRIAGLSRAELYVTQAFHLLPQTRSQGIRVSDVDSSFDQVTKYELIGRTVVAMGDHAARCCSRHGIKHLAVCHPSARGLGRTISAKASEIATALTAAKRQ